MASIPDNGEVQNTLRIHRVAFHFWGLWAGKLEGLCCRTTVESYIVQEKGHISYIEGIFEKR